MKMPSYRVYRFPPVIIQHAVWLDPRFTLSLRDVQDLLAERGIIVSHKAIRRWVIGFGPIYARRLRAMRPTPTGLWHLDEVLILSANSGGLNQGGKSGHACLGTRRFGQPMRNPRGIQGSGGAHLLQPGFGETDVTAS